jgi:hypothetical protein
LAASAKQESLPQGLNSIQLLLQSTTPQGFEFTQLLLETQLGRTHQSLIHPAHMFRVPTKKRFVYAKGSL